MLPVIIDSPTGKLSLLSAVALNPLLTGPVILGMNDVIVAVTIFVAVFALSRRRFALSALCFGMACTFKQSAWFAVPFYIVLLYRTLPEADRMRNLAKYVGIVVTVLLVIVGPFVLWDPPAFVTDVLAYPSGRVPLNYPIRGYTLGALLVGAGLIPSPLATFPFWIFQCLLGLPLLAVLLKYQWHHQGIGPMMLCSGIFIFGMGLLSRFFQDNYVGFVTIFMTMGILAATPNGIRRLQHEEC
jgi:hypothetical protein